MTNETYKRAEEIQNKLKDLDNLHYIACQPYKKYSLKKNFLCISTYGKDTVCISTEVIREYCNKRMQELRKELESL